MKPEDRNHYFQASEERRAPGKRWRLKKFFCGMSPAGSARVEDDGDYFEMLGMQRGNAASTCFFDEVSQTRALVHGDDFAAAGPNNCMQRVQGKMMEWYDVNVRFVFGKEADDDEEVVVLGTMVQCTPGSDGMIFPSVWTDVDGDAETSCRDTGAWPQGPSTWASNGRTSIPRSRRCAGG